MIKLYNTLTRKKEEFVPLSKTVTMYSCGPTVYQTAHIGNMRAYLFMDSLRRALAYNGYKLKGMMNITDVGHLLSDGDEGEDKLEKEAKAQKKSPFKIARHYESVFFADIARLNIQKPEIVERATSHINGMLDFVYELFDKGFAYETGDGIYFDISKFPSYGKLSGQKTDEQKAGARVAVNTEKRNPADFALWKKAPKEHIMQWPSRWGMGFPGWHIECSAMSREFLGCPFDIHTGGIDHIPVHHENEIAQTEALENKKAVNYWLHCEFMQVDGGKMSKSLGNTYTLSQLAEKGFSPMNFRYFCLNTHYRKALNFTFEGLNAAKTAYLRLTELLYQHKNSPSAAHGELPRFKDEFLNAVGDDLNYPLALGVLWTMLKLPLSREVYNAAIEFDSALGLNLKQSVAEFIPAPPPAADLSDVPQEVKSLLEQRAEARKSKDFRQSDLLRDQIALKGYTVIDSKDGQKLTKN